MSLTISPAQTEADRSACFALRETVFMGEQDVSEADEWDGLDDAATHLLLRLDDEPAGCLRLRQIDDIAKVERVCVLNAHRGKGLADSLMRAALAEVAAWPGVTTVKLSAQTQAMGLYERLGFTAYGPVYDDAGIPHRDMSLSL